MSIEYLYGVNILNKTLPLEKLNKYLKLSQLGDKNATNIILKHNFRLIIQILNSYYSQCNEETKKAFFSWMYWINASCQ